MTRDGQTILAVVAEAARSFAYKFRFMASLEALLRTPTICAALNQAWQESQPGLSGGHEEGGFIVQDSTGALRVIRWPRGSGSTIIVPAHDGCQFEGADIIASFHTHPNTGPDYLQEPTESEKRRARGPESEVAWLRGRTCNFRRRSFTVSRRQAASLNLAKLTASWPTPDGNAHAADSR